MVLQNYQKFIVLTSNMINIVALGVGFKCPRKIHLNSPAPKIFRPSVAPVTHLSSVIHHCTYFRYKSPNREQNIIRADGSDFKLQKSCYCYYVRKRKKNCLLTFKVNESMKALEYYILKKKC